VVALFILTFAKQTWRGVAIRSRLKQRRPRKLGRQPRTKRTASDDDDAQSINQSINETIL